MEKTPTRSWEPSLRHKLISVVVVNEWNDLKLALDAIIAHFRPIWHISMEAYFLDEKQIVINC